jgi:hypothetical protein
MKKVLFGLLFIASVTSSVFAQTEVPAVVKDAGHKKLGSAKAEWVKTSDGYKAVYQQSGKSMFLNYTSTGSLISEGYVIPMTELPAPVQEDAKRRFGTSAFVEAAKVTMNDGATVYEYQYKTGNSNVEVLYSADGKIIRRNVF